jgi:predicted metal-dependent enzyme (double-stranded beta helix superfamily)
MNFASPKFSPARIEERRVGLIGELAARISRACCEPPEAMGAQVAAALARAAAEPDLLDAAQRAAKPDCYARHVIYADPAGRFTVLAIVWGSGQFSAPHAHHTWCGYAVHDGTLEETLFAWNAEPGRAQPLRTERRPPGYKCFAGPGLEQIHKLGNPGSSPAISIHVYGVDREHIATGVNRMVQTAD